MIQKRRSTEQNEMKAKNLLKVANLDDDSVFGMYYLGNLNLITLIIP